MDPKDAVRSRNKLAKKVHRQQERGATASDADKAELARLETVIADAKPAVYDGVFRMYDGARGFGFIVCAKLGRDVFVHASELKDVDPGRLVTGQAVRFSTVVRDASRPAVAHAVELPPCGPSDAPTTYAGTVKFIDWTNGFGFARTDDLGDVYLPVANLVGLSEENLSPDDPVTFQLEDYLLGRRATACNIRAVEATGRC